MASETPEHDVPVPKRLLSEEIKIKDVLQLQSSVIIDDQNQKGCILKDSLVHKALLDLVDMGYIILDKEVREMDINTKTHSGLFLVGFSPTQVRAAKQYAQAFFMEGLSRNNLERQIFHYNNDQIIQLLRTLHYRDHAIERIEQMLKKNPDTKETVKLMIFAGLDTVFESINNPIGMEPGAKTSDEPKEDDIPASKKLKETEKNRTVFVKELKNINYPLSEIFAMIDNTFVENDIAISRDNAPSLLRTHIASALRCCSIISDFEDNRLDERSLKFLKTLSDCEKEFTESYALYLKESEGESNVKKSADDTSSNSISDVTGVSSDEGCCKSQTQAVDCKERCLEGNSSTP